MENVFSISTEKIETEIEKFLKSRTNKSPEKFEKIIRSEVNWLEFHEQIAQNENFAAEIRARGFSEGYEYRPYVHTKMNAHRTAIPK